MRCVIILFFIMIAGCASPKSAGLPYSQALGRYEGTDNNYVARVIVSNYTTELFDGIAMFAIPPKRTSSFTLKLEDAQPEFNTDQISVKVRKTVVEFQHDNGEIPGTSYSFVLAGVPLQDKEYYDMNWRKTILFEDVGKTEPYTTRLYFELDAKGNYGASKIDLIEAKSGNVLASIPLKKL